MGQMSFPPVTRGRVNEAFMQNEFSYKIFSVKNLDHTEVLVWTAHDQNRLSLFERLCG